MKMLYVGSICGNKYFEAVVSKSKIKPSAAPQHFEAAILKGLSSNEAVDLTCVSTESIATYPNGYKLFLESRVDTLDCGLKTKIVPAVNLPFIKPYMHARGVAKKVERWIKENISVKDKSVFLYGFNTLVAEATMKVCGKYGCKCFIMITDMPSIALTEYKGIKGYFKEKNRKHAERVQGDADGYIYITEQMADVIAPDKPHHVMEVLVDPDIMNKSLIIEKKKAIMYAGTLYEKYGIAMLIDIFDGLHTDYELWIMGSGDYEEIIKARAEKNPRIKFFGVLTREEVLLREREASLLVNIRNPEDEYTKYSFPSKMIEYMLSGTPVLTTKLPGFPKEYDPYLFYCEQYELESMVDRFTEVLNLPLKTLSEKGKKAAEYVKENKNCFTQMQRVISFISSQL